MGVFHTARNVFFGASFSPTIFQRQVKNQGLGEKGLMEVGSGGGRVSERNGGSEGAPKAWKRDPENSRVFVGCFFFQLYGYS